MKTVLIVEDNPHQVHLLEIMLSRFHLLTVQETNIFNILSLVEEKKVDIIILDIMLFEMSGDMMIKEIRVLDKLIPIIMITAITVEEMRIKCLQNGANYYMVKPFSFSDLQAVIRQYL